MKKTLSLMLPAAALLAFLATPEASAQITNPVVVTNQVLASTNLVAVNSATNPVPLSANWLKRHEGFVQIARQGGVDLLFMGDSITDGWRGGGGSNVWNQYYAPRHAANFGISGDRTEHVLWRIEHGELDGIKPKVVVLMIGTNNTKQGRKLVNTPSEVVEGVTAVVREIRARLPDSKILLLAIFPRGVFDDPQRSQVALINTVLAKLDDGAMVKFLDINPKFIEADGTLPRSVMPDLLHPNAAGYQIWADAMEGTLAEMMK